MGNRKENFKKSLGILDYPWSSDDDDDETQNDAVPSRPRLLTNESGPSDSSRHNGQAPPPTPALSPGRRAQSRLDSDIFWSFLNNRHRMAVVDPSRPGPSSFQPIESQGMDLESNVSNIQRMMAINNLPRRISMADFRASCIRNGLIKPLRGGYSPPPLVGNSRVSDFLARRSRGNRMPTAAGASTSEPNLNRSAIHAQDANLNASNSEDELENRSRHSMSPINAEGDDDTDNVNAAPQAEHAAPEEVVVEIEPDIEDDTRNGDGDAPPDDRANEPPNGESPQENNDGESSADRQGVKRKREEHEENDIQTVQEFNQSVLRLLECPVCMEWMEPPMSQCRRGHLVCGSCRLRLNACPVCRTAFSSVRNRAMESVAELLRYPCRHGCGREARLRRRGSHEASCDARRYRCPVPPCSEGAPFPLEELHYHFQARHLPILKVGRRHTLSLRVNSEQHDTWLVMAARELFHLRVDVDVHMWGMIVYVAYIGPRCNAKNFTYEVSVTGQHNQRRLSYSRATHSDLESSTINVSRQDCFHLTLDQALNFLRLKNRHCEPDKSLEFVVEIRRNDTPPATTRDNSDS